MVDVHDFHATILHLLGLNYETLTYYYNRCLLKPSRAPDTNNPRNSERQDHRRRPRIKIARETTEFVRHAMGQSLVELATIFFVNAQPRVDRRELNFNWEALAPACRTRAVGVGGSRPDLGVAPQIRAST